MSMRKIASTMDELQINFIELMLINYDGGFMADLKMPEMNSVVIAGNLTKDPVFRQTTNGTPVVNFTVASNRKFRDSGNQMAGRRLLCRDCRVEQTCG